MFYLSASFCSYGERVGQEDIWFCELQTKKRSTVEADRSLWDLCHGSRIHACVGPETLHQDSRGGKIKVNSSLGHMRYGWKIDSKAMQPLAVHIRDRKGERVSGSVEDTGVNMSTFWGGVLSRTPLCLLRLPYSSLLWLSHLWSANHNKASAHSLDSLPTWMPPMWRFSQSASLYYLAVILLLEDRKSSQTQGPLDLLQCVLTFHTANYHHQEQPLWPVSMPPSNLHVLGWRFGWDLSFFFC